MKKTIQKSARKSARKTVRKTIRKTRKRSKIINYTYPLPLSFATKLKYVETFTMDPASLSNQSYIFSANGLYDPNITGTGHQPYGFDTLMSMYNHYHVIGSKIKLRLANTGTFTYYAGILLRDTATANSTTYGTNFLLEQPNSRFKLVPYGNSGGSITTIRQNFSAKKFFKSKAILENTLFRGDINANPTEGAFYHVIITPYNDTTDNIPLQAFTVEIEYLAVFTEVKMLGPS